MRTGDTVTHKTRGRGRIVGVWGDFASCSRCNHAVKDIKEKLSSCCGVETMKIMGGEIMEVKFEKEEKVAAVNKCWLKRVRK